jgi:hypothetical protein
MTQVKKNYASIQEIQEGNIVPYDKQLDIKGNPKIDVIFNAEIIGA